MRKYLYMMYKLNSFIYQNNKLLKMYTRKSIIPGGLTFYRKLFLGPNIYAPTSNIYVA